MPELLAAAQRLDSPLRVAIAGQVKAGKSTLLNALVGEELAPTDAGECTRVVTWYRDGLTYRGSRRSPATAAARELPPAREGTLELAWAGVRPGRGRPPRPSTGPRPTLAPMTLIDTPGIASLTAELVRAHRVAFLTPDDERRPRGRRRRLPDAPHARRPTSRFLEAFHEHEPVRAPRRSTPSPCSSRADEIGAGRLDALTARPGAIAAGCRARRTRSRALCQTVVPVAGLLAETGRTLREDEFRAHRAARRRRPETEVERAAAVRGPVRGGDSDRGPRAVTAAPRCSTASACSACACPCAGAPAGSRDASALAAELSTAADSMRCARR